MVGMMDGCKVERRQMDEGKSDGWIERSQADEQTNE